MDGLVLDEGLRLLGLVVSLYSMALALEPVEIRRELWKNRINLGATHAGRAAHRFVIDLYSFHGLLRVEVVRNSFTDSRSDFSASTSHRC